MMPCTLQSFSDVSGLSMKRLRQIRQTDPDFLGYDPKTGWYNRARALTIGRIRQRYTTNRAAELLNTSDVLVRYYAKRLGLGKKIYDGMATRSRLYLSKGELRVIDAYMHRHEKNFRSRLLHTV